MSKILLIIVGTLMMGLGWLFWEKPQPPFGAVLEVNSVPKAILNNQDIIEYSYTDDNTGEDLIINTDKENYTGPGETTVYLSIQNISNKNQNVDLIFYTDATVVEIQELVFNVPYQRTINDYGTEQVCVDEIDENGNLITSCNYPIIGNHFETYYVDEWQNKEKNSREVVRPIRAKTVENLNQKGNITSLINSGATKYFKAKLQYKPFSSREEFFIEAIGDQGGYGNLR